MVNLHLLSIPFLSNPFHSRLLIFLKSKFHSIPFDSWFCKHPMMLMISLYYNHVLNLTHDLNIPSYQLFKLLIQIYILINFHILGCLCRLLATNSLSPSSSINLLCSSLYNSAVDPTFQNLNKIHSNYFFIFKSNMFLMTKS